MQKRWISLETLYKLIVHGVMLFTVLATILLFIRPQIALKLFSVGASSGFVALGFFCSDVRHYFWDVVAIVWCLIFPILMLGSYVFAIKKEYVPFCVAVVCDTIFLLLWSIYSTIDGNYFGLKTFAIDAAVSIVLAIVLVRITYLLVKEKRTVE